LQVKSKSKTKEENQNMKTKEQKDIRTNRISLRLTDSELASIQKNAKDTNARKVALYIRNSALNKLPVEVPELNKESWVVLATAVSNLNQLMKKMNNPGAKLQVGEVKNTVDELRSSLLGIKFEAKDEG
jgi:hypothetical protein